MSEIFISYRRSDSAGHARALYRDLCRHFDLENIFFDRSSIESGDIFPERLEIGVSKCEVLLALIGPEWLEVENEEGGRRLEDPNDFVRQEVARALLLGKKIIPVLFDDTPMPSKNRLPGPFKSLASHDALTLRGKSYEYDEQLNELVRLLAVVPGVPEPKPCGEVPSVYIGVPPLPANFLGRERLMDSLIRGLLSGRERSLALEGSAGIGKTTLAVSLASDQGVLRHFKDGVLWGGLGKQPDVMNCLEIWATALNKDISGLATLAERIQAVKDAIGLKYMLIVIDDAWDIYSANALRCGGPNCCHLLSTRDKGIARAFAGPSLARPVPTLGDDTSYELLQCLAPEACEVEPLTARDLAQSMGGLPLALELLGGYLAAPERSLFPDLSSEA